MSSNRELCNRLIAIMNRLVSQENSHHKINWAWIVVAILEANSIALSQIATHLPGGDQSRVAHHNDPLLAEELEGYNLKFVSTRPGPSVGRLAGG